MLTAVDSPQDSCPLAPQGQVHPIPTVKVRLNEHNLWEKVPGKYVVCDDCFGHYQKNIVPRRKASGRPLDLEPILD